MRPTRFVGWAGALVVVGCVTPVGSGSSSARYETSPRPQTAPTQTYAQARDSLFAQMVADREGPRVSIHAEVSTFTGSRRARGVFDIQDDAYVVVGHIDADGVVRIAFPGDPSDDGFVKGDHQYRTPEFFAGFAGEYAYRYRTSLVHYNASTPESYDGGLGYVFVIASWRPMHMDMFATSGVWDTFELADAQYLNDPRPAIYELASILAGENREAYTVKFARYTSTQSLDGGQAYYSSINSFDNNSAFCSGFSPSGYGWSPFSGAFGVSNFASYYNDALYYRGTPYYYNNSFGCYTTFPFSYGYPTRYGPGQIATNPPTSPTTPIRTFNLDGRRSPPTPIPVDGGYRLPTSTGGAAAVGTHEEARRDPSNSGVRVSPHYRDRGLLTTDDGSAPNTRVGASTGQERTRPSIQEMINRREPGVGSAGGARIDQNSRNGGDTWARSQGRNGGVNDGANRGVTTSNPSSGSERRFNPSSDRGAGEISGGTGARMSPSSPAGASPSSPSSAGRIGGSSPAPVSSPPPASSSSSGSSNPGSAPIKP